MSSREKKRQEPSYESEEDKESDEMVESDEEPSDKEIQAEFQFFDPVEEDSQAIAELLANQLRDIDLDVADLTKSIIQQKTVGSVVKCGEGDEAYICGLISVFNFLQHKNCEWMRKIKSFILTQCSDATKKQLFQQMMESGKTGLIVNERLFNCPPQVGPPLNQSLFEEMSWAQEDEPTQILRDSFELEHYILVTKVFVNPTAEEDQNHSSKKSKTKGPSGYIYIKPEDEFYHKFSTEWFCNPLQQERNDGLESLRLFILISHNEAQQARFALDGVVGNPARVG